MPPRRNPSTGPNVLEMGDAEDRVVPPKTVAIPVKGFVHPDPTQLLAAVTQLVTAITQEREAREPFARHGCTLKNFCNHNFDSLRVLETILVLIIG
jgi:hypothetical protein